VTSPRLYVPLVVDYLDDPKFETLSVEAELLYIRSLCLAKRRMSDGHIDGRQLRRLCDRFDANPSTVAAELVAEELWVEVDGGWQIVAWLKHNQPKAAIEQRRIEAAERKAAWRKNATQDTSSRDANATRDKLSRDAGQVVAVSERDTGPNGTRRAEKTETETETETERSSSSASDDHDRTVELLLLRRRQQHERSGKHIDNPDAWTRSVRAGLQREHGDRIAADLALGLAPDTIAASILPDRNPDPPMAAYHRVDSNAVMARALALVAPEDR
jgi:hypothetical protein